VLNSSESVAGVIIWRLNLLPQNPTLASEISQIEPWSTVVSKATTFYAFCAHYITWLHSTCYEVSAAWSQYRWGRWWLGQRGRQARGVWL